MSLSDLPCAVCTIVPFEDGRKRANTTSRWEGGGGAPETAPGGARNRMANGCGTTGTGSRPSGPTPLPRRSPIHTPSPPHPTRARACGWVSTPPQSPPTPCEDKGGREPLRRPRTRHDSQTIVASTRARSRSTNLSIYLLLVDLQRDTRATTRVRGAPSSHKRPKQSRSTELLRTSIFSLRVLSPRMFDTF